MRAALALILILCSVPAYGRDREVTVRQECHGDRCVLYDKFGRRIGTVTRDSTGRVKVRDKEGRLRATVTGDKVKVD